MFIYFQRKNSIIGPVVAEKVRQLCIKYVCVKVIKSGKIQKNTNELFLNHIVSPYEKVINFEWLLFSGENHQTPKYAIKSSSVKMVYSSTH